MPFSNRLISGAKIALFSTFSLLPTTQTIAYKCIDPKKFTLEQSPKILQNLGASETLLKINQVASKKMTEIIESQMVQKMAKGTLTKEEWDSRYMQPDVLYINNLGRALAERSVKEDEKDRLMMMELAEMFLGYGKHFERLKKYGLSAKDTLMSPECDKHIDLLSKNTSTNEFYFAILTDMIPYVIFANYLLHSIGSLDDNLWREYAIKYGDLNNKYAKEKLGKTIQIANEILMSGGIDIDTAEKLFQEGFAFEEWFIRNAFSKGFKIKSYIANSESND